MSNSSLHSPTSFPSTISNDDGMGYRHLIITWYVVDLTSQTKVKVKCLPFTSTTTVSKATGQSGVWLPEVRSCCPFLMLASLPLKPSMKLLSSVSPVSICICPLIRYLNYSRLSSFLLWLRDCISFIIGIIRIIVFVMFFSLNLSDDRERERDSRSYLLNLPLGKRVSWKQPWMLVRKLRNINGYS